MIYKTLYCVECGHSQRNHVKLHREGKHGMLNHKCLNCDCYGVTNWSINGNGWKYNTNKRVLNPPVKNPIKML